MSEGENVNEFMMATDAAQILAADDIAYEEVPVPEWRLRVLVRGMTGNERDAFEQTIVRGHGKEREFNLNNARARFVAKCIVHPETHKRLFTPQQIDALGKKSSAALQRVYEVAMRLSGLTDDDMKDLEKNFESDQSDDSISD